MRPPAPLSRAIGGRGRNYLRILAGRAVDELVLELDAAYAFHLINTPDNADDSQALTYVDIDTFLASF